MMHKLLIGLLVITLVAMLGYGGYCLVGAILKSNEAPQEQPTDDRFVVTSRQVNIPTGYSASYVLCDTQTDTEYLVLFGIQSVAVMPLGTTCQPYVRLVSE